LPIARGTGRLVQQVERTAFEDTVAGRRVVISGDGGRLRLRETTRDPRQKGTWAPRERGAPKVLLVDVVDAEGKRDATLCRDGCSPQGPDAVFALLHLLATPRDPRPITSLYRR
jgi:hypothetical protein